MLIYHLFILAISDVSSHLLNSLLHSYQTLHKDDVLIRHFSSKTLILSLKLDDTVHVASLTPYQEIFHKHFKTVVLDANSTTHLNDPIKGHYLGQLDRYNDSRVVIHIEDDGLITGNIEYDGKLYYIEPSWRHISEPHEFHMIVYRKSDVINNLGHLGQFCSHDDFDTPVIFSVDQNNDSHSFEYETRLKRASRPKNTCEVILIADYKFYSQIGGSNEFKTKTFLIAIFERINHIFKSTVFETSDKKFSGYGMQIKTILIHKSPSSDPSNYNHQRFGGWDVTEMLNAFGHGTEYLGETWSNYCLAHLYTNYDFDLGVLGLAYVASPIRYVELI